MPQRLEQLQRWLQNGLGLQDYHIAPASADASFRRYFRIRFDDQSRIVMDAPPEKEDCEPFVRIAAQMGRAGLHVPQVLEQDLQQGFLLLSDLGERNYLDSLNEHTVQSLYGDAIAALWRLQSGMAPDTAGIPPYDHALLMREMDLFRDWYLGTHLGRALSDVEHDELAGVFERLAANALEQPRVCVHRDYHSRNLMVCEDNPGVLDFQDAVSGPFTYDLVSLLRDCYVAWPRHQVEAWALEYLKGAQQAGIVRDVDAHRFLRWFDLMGVQRHLKATGIFARLNHRDGKPGYLGDIPRVLGYMREVSGRYAELAPLAQLLEALD